MSMDACCGWKGMEISSSMACTALATSAPAASLSRASSSADGKRKLSSVVTGNTRIPSSAAATSVYLQNLASKTPAERSTKRWPAWAGSSASGGRGNGKRDWSCKRWGTSMSCRTRPAAMASRLCGSHSTKASPSITAGSEANPGSAPCSLPTSCSIAAAPREDARTSRRGRPWTHARVSRTMATLTFSAARLSRPWTTWSYLSINSGVGSSASGISRTTVRTPLCRATVISPAHQGRRKTWRVATTTSVSV
mmetsp:Transcript_139047/g.432597  ORF Transcript_139047/g.432597 Transcript_139047/m.432597 type:complete len:252 (-) Transcript_139047:273-1028(-)